MKTSLVLAILALALPMLFVLSTLLLKFRFTFDWQFPKEAHFEASFIFFGFTKKIHRNLSKSKKSATAPQVNSEATLKLTAKKITNLNPKQRGFLLIPRLSSKLSTTLSNKFSGIRKNFRKAWLKFLLESHVWKLVIVALLNICKRILSLIDLRLDALAVGIKDVNTMAQFAAFWSILSGLLPRLRCPVQYHFCSPKPIFHIKLQAEFTAFQLFWTCIVMLFTFPWIRLAMHFLHCWRNPLLKFWQRRLLLFLPI